MRFVFALLAIVILVIPARAGDNKSKSKGLVLEGIKGESQDERHKDSIHIESAKSAGSPKVTGASSTNATKMKR